MEPEELKDYEALLDEKQKQVLEDWVEKWEPELHVEELDLEEEDKENLVVYYEANYDKLLETMGWDIGLPYETQQEALERTKATLREWASQFIWRGWHDLLRVPLADNV
jgi:hypothetical protein